VTRHLQFLKKSFDLAINRDLMSHNPLHLVKMAPYLTPAQDYLTLKELKLVLAEPSWKQNWLVRGVSKIPLPFSWLDIVLLLFTSCKRRSEIIKLRIENINYQYHFCYYLEQKNRSKPGIGSIGKAFWLTSGMEQLLKRIVGDRQEGLVFANPGNEDIPINADLISERFEKIAQKVNPKKHLTLKNLRQTAYQILEDTRKISVPEIDLVLGHYNVKTALPFYQDRSIEARGKRLSEQNKKGVELLFKSVKEFYDKQPRPLGSI
jgi:integrase